MGTDNAFVGWLDSRAANRMVQLVAVIALILSGYIGFRQYSLASCLADYSDRSARSSAARADAAEHDRQAQDAMWQAFADASDPAKVPPEKAHEYADAAFKSFLADRVEANRQRANNPPPAPPSQVCR